MRIVLVGAVLVVALLVGRSSLSPVRLAHGGFGLRDAALKPGAYLVTGGPGWDAFSLFGHASICIASTPSPTLSTADGERPPSAPPRCFDFGQADVRDPLRVLWDVTRGRPSFFGMETNFEQLRDAFVLGDRTLTTVRLPLDGAAVEALDGRLTALTQPPQSYVYDPATHNCSTRVRDLLDEALGGALRPLVGIGSGETMRSLARESLAGHALLGTAMALSFSREGHRELSRWEAMLLPSRLQAEVAAIPGTETHDIYTRQENGLTQSPHGPAVFFVAVPLFALWTLRRARTPRALRSATLRWGALAGAVGTVLWVGGSVTTLTAFFLPVAMVLFWPTDAAIGLLSERMAGRYLALRACAILGAAVASAVGAFPLELLPLALTMGLGVGQAWAGTRFRQPSPQTAPLSAAELGPLESATKS